VPGTYRGINLLVSCVTLKVVTKIITSVTNERQQEFRSRRSCTDTVFFIRQITKKSIEYIILLFYRFSCMIDNIEDIYPNNRIQAQIDKKTHRINNRREGYTRRLPEPITI